MIIAPSARLHVFGYYYVVFQAAPGFLSSRVMNSWPGVEPWREILEWSAIFFQRPLPGLVGISNSNFKRKKLTKLLCSRYHCSLNIWFIHNIVKSRYAFGTLSGIQFTPHDVVKPSCTNRINILCKTTTSYMLRECFGYNRVVFVCPSCDHRQASYMFRLEIGEFVTKIGRNSNVHIRVAIVCQNRLGMTPALTLTPNTGFYRLLHTIRRR